MSTPSTSTDPSNGTEEAKPRRSLEWCYVTPKRTETTDNMREESDKKSTTDTRKTPIHKSAQRIRPDVRTPEIHKTPKRMYQKEPLSSPMPTRQLSDWIQWKPSPKTKSIVEKPPSISENSELPDVTDKVPTIKRGWETKNSVSGAAEKPATLSERIPSIKVNPKDSKALQKAESNSVISETPVITEVVEKTEKASEQEMIQMAIEALESRFTPKEYVFPTPDVTGSQSIQTPSGSEAVEEPKEVLPVTKPPQKCCPVCVRLSEKCKEATERATLAENREAIYKERVMKYKEMDKTLEDIGRRIDQREINHKKHIKDLEKLKSRILRQEDVERQLKATNKELSKTNKNLEKQVANLKQKLKERNERNGMLAEPEPPVAKEEQAPEPEGEDECYVCLRPVNSDEELLTCNQCQKSAHHHCLAPWLNEYNGTCGACRNPMVDPKARKPYRACFFN